MELPCRKCGGLAHQINTKNRIGFHRLVTFHVHLAVGSEVDDLSPFERLPRPPPASFLSVTNLFNTSSTFANLVDDMPTSSGFATGSSLAAIPLQRVRAKRIGEIRLFIFSMGGLVRVRLDLSVGGLSKPAKSMGGMVQPAITEHFGGKLFHISH